MPSCFDTPTRTLDPEVIGLLDDVLSRFIDIQRKDTLNTPEQSYIIAVGSLTCAQLKVLLRAAMCHEKYHDKLIQDFQKLAEAQESSEHQRPENLELHRRSLRALVILTKARVEAILSSILTKQEEGMDVDSAPGFAGLNGRFSALEKGKAPMQPDGLEEIGQLLGAFCLEAKSDGQGDDAGRGHWKEEGSSGSQSG